MRDFVSSLSHPATRCWQSVRPGLRILMYHRVDALERYDQLNVEPPQFQEQMRLLAERNCVVRLGSNATDGKIAITFDDGYLDNLCHAAPILRQFNLPATIYLTTDFVNQTRSHPRYKESTTQLHMTWSDVRCLHTEGLINFGAHTCTHPMLSELSNTDAKTEIFDSKALLEDQLGDEVTSFAYPNGNYSRRERDLVEEAGYENAVTVKPGLNRSKTDRLALRRTEVTDHDHCNAFQAKLDGALDPAHALLDMKREWQFKRRRNRVIK